MRWTSGVAVFVLLVVAGAGAVTLLNRLPHSETTLPAPPPPPPLDLPPPAVGSEWRYTTPKTPYASDFGQEACTRSAGDVEIGGGHKSGARLCLRRGGGYPYAGSVVLGDMTGRFTCRGCAVRVSFDGAAAQSFDGTAASTDGTAYALFIRDGAGLASALKRASTARFSAAIQGAGEQTVTFDVAGLKWER